MPLTKYPNGVSSFGIPLFGDKPRQGNTFFVNYSTGNDALEGTSPDTAFKTLAKALSMCTANQNDTVYLFSTTNAATPGTQRVATGGLDWNKDGVHLIGICSGNHAQQRARISTATTDVTTNTVLTISANNCHIENISVFHGINSWVGADGGVPTAVKVTGQRNNFVNCSFSGLGDSASANDMDVADGSSLWLASAENTFLRCYLGLETVYLGNTTAGVIRTSGTQTISRNLFKDCLISSRASHANHAPVNVGAASLQDMGMYFDGCIFTNSGIFAGGVAADEVFDVGASQNGGIVVNGATCMAVGFSFWEKATVSGNVYVSNPAVGAGKAGLATVAVGS